MIAFVLIVRSGLCLRSKLVRDLVIYMSWREGPWNVIFRYCSVVAGVWIDGFVTVTVSREGV